MKIALQIGLLPGKDPAEKARWARDHGVEGIELNIGGCDGPDALRKQAEQITPHLPVTSVCGNMSTAGERSFDFLAPDRARRRVSIDGSKAILDVCGEFGAVGQIVPPIFGGPMVPDLSPVMGVLELEDKLMVAACEELGPYAAERKTLFMLEPLNRYEQHYLRRQADGMRIMDQLSPEARKGVGLLSDFFHMHIEETSTPEAFREAAKHTSHIHLADNTRQEPGTGDIDFVAAFKVLHEAGFDGYMAYECGISGSGEDKPKQLAKSVEYVRACIEKARSGAPVGSA